MAAEALLVDRAVAFPTLVVRRGDGVAGCTRQPAAAPRRCSLPGALVTVTAPSMSSMMRLTIESPKPVPP